MFKIIGIIVLVILMSWITLAVLKAYSNAHPEKAGIKAFFDILTSINPFKNH